MPRFIAIMGPSFCGSTLLGGLLDNVPGVAGAGELHWIIDKPERAFCNGCRAERLDELACPVVQDIARPGLEDSNLYRRAAEALGCEVLVSGDKSPWLVQRFIRPRDIEVLLSFRRPEAFASSAQRRPGAWARPVPETFVNFYRRILQFAKGSPRLTVVQHEDLAESVETYMPKLCASLELPPPTEIRYPPRRWHNIGGNKRSLQGVEDVEPRPIRLDPHWERELTPRQIAELRSHGAMMRLWRELQEMAL